MSNQFYAVFLYTFSFLKDHQRIKGKAILGNELGSVMPKQNFRNVRIDGITKDNLFHGLSSPASRFLFY